MLHVGALFQIRIGDVSLNAMALVIAYQTESTNF